MEHRSRHLRLGQGARHERRAVLTPAARQKAHELLDQLMDAMGGASAPPVAGPARGALTFDADFSGLKGSLFETWDSVPAVNDPAGNGSSLPGNSERQWYINHRYALTQGLKPWRTEGGELIITADRVPPDLARFMGYSASDQPALQPQFALGTYPYYSGRLDTHGHFTQLYGYFEAECKLPAGKGLWPAFWLLPADMAWPPEIDVFEVLGHEPSRVYQTLHWHDPAPNGDHKSAYVDTQGIDTTEWHTYGVNWRPGLVDFYIDGVARKSFITPADMKKPMYLILNLAVGGSWPGNPDADTVFPAEMRVRSVRAWA
jgi:beta-glucanase (GH16 family)